MEKTVLDYATRLGSGAGYDASAIAALLPEGARASFFFPEPVAAPEGKALVQTVDILAPVVNDAFSYGRIAACNALSDVYAMGGTPWRALTIACAPRDILENEPEVVKNAVLGAREAMEEAGCLSPGGRLVSDVEMKFGLAVTGLIDPKKVATNANLCPGDILLLTKPLGTGILANGIKARWDDWEESEKLIRKWAGRLNKVAGSAIEKFALKAATDITGFGLGGHCLEMARASDASLEIDARSLPVMGKALDYASDGLVPGGSINNKLFCACKTRFAGEKDDDLENLVFDTQTSGGLLLAVPRDRLGEVRDYLLAGGDLACEVGRVVERREAPLYLIF